MTQRDRIQLKLNESKKVNVEFALIDDIKKSAYLAKSLKEKIESNFSSANGGLRAVADFNKGYDEAVKTAKAVGFSIPPELSGLTSLMKSYEDFFKKIQSL